MIVFAACWICHPELLQRRSTSEQHPRSDVEYETRPPIDPVGADALIKNIRGIPFLIQAIQYSMETSYYRDLLSEMGDGLVRTSVIHTAPGCHSLLDSDSEAEDEPLVTDTPRNSGMEQQWLPYGESWRNEQLRLSLSSNTASANMLVFPYRESSSPANERLNHVSTPELKRADWIRRIEGGTPSGTRPFQVRCIGQSASFLTRFTSGLGSLDRPDPDVEDSFSA